jgi:hypothetical protein
VPEFGTQKAVGNEQKIKYEAVGPSVTSNAMNEVEGSQRKANLNE